MNIITTRSKKGSFINFTFDIVKVSLYKVAVMYHFACFERGIFAVLFAHSSSRSGVAEGRLRIFFVEIVFSAIILFAFLVSFWFQNDRGVNMQYSLFLFVSRFSNIPPLYCRWCVKQYPINQSCPTGRFRKKNES